MSNSKIIIIGAGASGIAAATRLYKNGFQNLTILEAENRIGGRINSVEFGGSIVDLGGQWCHGEEDNIVYEMVKDLNLLATAHNSYQDNTYYLSNGTLIDKTISDGLFKIAVGLFEDEELAKAHGGSFGEYFTKHYNQEVLKTFGANKEALKLAEIMLDWFHKFMLCLDSPKDWNDISSTSPFAFKSCKGDQQLQWKNKGYRTILDILLDRFPDATNESPVINKIMLNKEVSQIVWSDTTQTINCSDGTSYTAEHVIVTVSLGVLKDQYQSLFSPSLEKRRAFAIDCMTIGVVNKILLKFPTKWWPNEVKGFSLVWSKDDSARLLEEFPHGPTHNGKSWLEYVFGFYVIDSHPSTLLGWVVGPVAAEVEKLDDDLVKRGSMLLLQKFVGDLYDIPEPDDILRSKWKSNKHFSGSYTNLSTLAELNNISGDDLAKPILNSSLKPIILFAGEHTHSKHFSTVHGAIETGYREADRLIEYYKN